jgi:glutamate mutase epsilon subunit
MSTCNECDNYDPIDGSSGKCKYHEAERHVVEIDSHSTEVLNGWPIVNGNEQACRNFE